jgi:DNA-binding transcriptional MerR regulator
VTNTNGTGLLELDSVVGYRVHADEVRTSEVAAQAHVNAQTLRYYERRGLLPEPERTHAGYRSYTPDAVRVVRFVKRAQQLGFTLGDIEDLLHLADGGPASCEDTLAMARSRITDLQRRIDELMGMRDALARLIDTCDRPPNATARSCTTSKPSPPPQRRPLRNGCHAC